MKVALFSSNVPFIRGGGRQIVDWLVPTLREHGHTPEVYYLPFREDPPVQMLAQIAAYRSIDLSAADRVIAFRPPAYVVEHDNKVLWFIHHFRYFYDLWETDYRWFPDDAKHRAIRDAIHDIDQRALGEARHIFTNSRVVSRRLREYNDLDSEVLYPPILGGEQFVDLGSNDELVCVCRVEPAKRQHLLIEALALTRTPVRLALLGASSNIGYVAAIREAITTLDLAGRVRFENRWVSEDEKRETLGNSLASVYVPFDEDSYGYPTLEAAHSSKPTLSLDDAGGVSEFIVDGESGRIVHNDPHTLAAAMDELYTQRAATQRMGRAARERLDALDISWDHVVERLTA